MKRRKFLGFLGGAAVAGPAAAQTAAAATMGDLSLAKLGVAAGSIGPGASLSGPPTHSHAEWAKDRLKRVLGRTVAAKAMEKQQFYLDSLDPDIAACRSISLVNKIRMSRDVKFDRHEAKEKTYLQGVIERLWE